MSVIIGLDLGARSACVSLWNEDKMKSSSSSSPSKLVGADEGDVDVMTDEFGERSVSSAIAFRDGEVLVGEIAIQQRHKNMQNTFVDVRSILAGSSSTNSSSSSGGGGSSSPASPGAIESSSDDDIYIESLDADMSRVDLVSKFFRYIHNEIKRQSGKIIKDCIITIPDSMNESVIEDIKESAKKGGIRIKHFIPENIAVLLAYGLDDPNVSINNVLVADIGWGSSKFSVWNIKKGLFLPVSQLSTNECSGSKLANNLMKFCIQDFERKTKLSDMSKKSIARLLKECESAIKNLSTSPEVNIEIDSLFEGVDYAVKISRARFEDLSMDAFNTLRQTLIACISDANLSIESDAITVCFAGGLCNLPKVKTIFSNNIPNMIVNRTRYDTSEVCSIGAALHGKYLHQADLLNKPPSEELIVSRLMLKLNITAAGESNETSSTIGTIDNESVLPYKSKYSFPSSFSKVSISVENPANKSEFITIGEVSFSSGSNGSSYSAIVNITEESIIITIEDSNNKEIANNVISLQ